MYINPIVNPHLESQTGWASHIPSDGSGIGGTDPTSYLMLQSAAGLANGLFLDVAGLAYASVEHYLLTPIVTPNTGNLVLAYDLTVDESQTIQAIETDTILCSDGYNYNLSCQVNYEEKGMIQIANQSGGWVDTGVVIPLFTPQEKYSIAIGYKFNLTTNTSSVVSYTLDGTKYPISLQALNAVEKNWADGALVQVQQTLNSQGGQFSMLIENMEYRWS